MQVYANDGRPLPLITPITQPYFDAARDNKLLLQKCPRDGFFFYPRSHCPHCLQTDWSWQRAKLGGKIYSFTIERMGQAPGMQALVPFAIAVVELDDGPRAIGHVVDSPVDAIRIGMSVSVCFDLVDGVALMQFRPD